MDYDAWPKKANMHSIDGRQPKSRPRKRLCDVIPVDMKSLNLSNQGSYRIYDFFSLLFMTFTTTKDINFHDHFLNLVLVLLT